MRRKLISLDLKYYSPSVNKVSIFESQSYFGRTQYFFPFHKIILLIFLRKSGDSHILQNRCIESEKETEIAIFIYTCFLTKHVYWHLIDYQPFYLESGLFSKIIVCINFIISLISFRLPYRVWTDIF